MCVCSWLWASTDLQHEGILFKAYNLWQKKGAQIDKLKKLLCPNLLNISKADVSRECDECSFNKTPTQSLAELSIKVGKISDDRGQWNIGWWCLMTNDWAGGFCAGVTTVIYSCRSHQSEQFQCSSPSSHFNELGLSFNFAFPQCHFKRKVQSQSSFPVYKY